jgi:hypothetical protein
MIKKLLFVFIFLILAGVVSLVIFIDPIVKYSVNTYGPAVLDAPVSLDSAGISFAKSAIELKGIKLGDKKTGELQADRIFVDIQPMSLFGEVLGFNSIQIEGVAFNYAANGSSNVSDLLENIKKNERKQEEKQTSKQEGKNPLERKIYIKNLDFVNCSVSLAGGDKKMVVPFPNLRMKEIGNPTTGITVMNATVKIFTQLSIELVKSMQKHTGDIVKKGISEGLGLGESISNLFK